MPTISSSLDQPLVTPSTALFTSARTRPCTAERSSFSRVTWMWPSAAWSFTPAGRCVCTWPFGPCTTTVLPFTSNFTPCGSGIGFFPMRDIVLNPFIKRVLQAVSWPNSTLVTGLIALRVSPHFAQNLATHAFFACLAAGHHSLGSGENVDAQPAQDARDFVVPHVHAAAGTRNALQIGNGGGIVRPVLQINAQDLAAFLFRRLEIGDVAFFFQNACDLLLQPRSGNIKLLVTRVDRITNARQQICDRIGQTHLLSSPLFVTRLPRPAGEPAVTYYRSTQHSALSRQLEYRWPRAVQLFRSSPVQRPMQSLWLNADC